MYNIFIEGIQGSGKSTLCGKLEKELPNYKFHGEGKLSPVELQWCSYMISHEYDEICEKYSDIKEEIETYTLTEGSKKIVAYTKILTDYEGFHKELESYNIYFGNRCFEEFRSIILRRYSNLETNGHIFECSFFQNTITTMMLFYEMNDDEIIDFYKEAFEILKNKNFRLVYLDAENISATINTVKNERVDENGKEIWSPLVENFITNSPLGLVKSLEGFNGVITHLESRRKLELRIIDEVVKVGALVIRSKDYDVDVDLKSLFE